MYAYSVRHVFVENIYIKAAPGTQVTYKSTDYVPYVRIYVCVRTSTNAIFSNPRSITVFYNIYTTETEIIAII